MASIMQNCSCPKCGGISIEDDYYKIGELYIYCYCCGYYFIRKQEFYEKEENRVHYKEEECGGFGIFLLAKKDGSKSLFPLEAPLTDEKLGEYKEKLDNAEVDIENSYLVSYSDGIFNTLFGDVPEKYRISYEEYQKKGYINIITL
ncbi:hypothetical protein V7182_22985 [Neobacillus drentensis]|uniref:hypothetical protein n=1 Tax=Neobacillus drentensis TaxID=220684 RepID=UPI0030007983